MILTEQRSINYHSRVKSHLSRHDEDVNVEP